MRHRLLDTHYRKKDLIGRGWTADMIARHLGQPDRVTPWNYNRICWYEHGRVHEAEQQDVVQKEMQEAARRKEDWRAGEPERMRRREERDMAWLKRKVPAATNVAVIDQDELERRAAKTRYGKFKSKECGLVAFIRHNLSNYDDLLWQFKTHGQPWRYPTVKATVLNAIAKAYPALADECGRQIAGLEGATE